MRRSYSFWTFALLSLAVVACRQQVEPIQEPEISDLPAYFWSGTPSSMRFSSGNGSYDVVNFVSLSAGLVLQENNTISITFHVTPDSITATGFRRGSLLDLDGDSFFGAQDSEIVVQPKITAAIDLDTVQYAATDNGIYRFNGHTWTLDDPNLVSVNCFAFDAPTGHLFAATPTGDILWRATGGPGSWQHLASRIPVSGPIHALLFYGGSLFAAPENSVGVYILKGLYGPWTQAPSVHDQITALCASSDKQIVLAGSVGGSIWALTPAGGSPGAAVTLPASGKIYSIAQYNSGLVAGTANGVYMSSALTATWTHVAPYGLPSPVTAVVTKHTYSEPDTLCMLAGGDYYWMDTSGTKFGKVHVPAAPSQFVVNGGVAVITDFTIFGSSSANGNWTPLLPPLPTVYSNIEGPLVLLRQDRTIPNASWHAGTLVDPAHNWHSYPITGRVVEQLDTLQITNGAVTKSYPSVLVVRYARELQDGSAQSDTIPYWIVYYHKGLGPIMFDKEEGGTLTRRQIQ
ncbi:MAG: hypothetical protein Q8922_09500 [Bacteroidota bacterium]|nr:hypothetical protein [Bacteroidota bacterium]MDP4234427.1 hypothetical protein [Bacteroidota bacterium]MDP4243993.1 hypothetical protein [Bacteroidota bacterium]MDP4288159.1 hypothetical protein [Bacteroidota bacterium]